MDSALTLRHVLQSGRDANQLLSGWLTDIGAVLAGHLPPDLVADSGVLEAFWARLADDMLTVQGGSSERELWVCGGRLRFLMDAAHEAPAEPPSLATDLRCLTMTIDPCAPWASPNDDQWLVVLEDWLAASLRQWRDAQGKPRLHGGLSGYPEDSIFHAEFARALVRQAGPVNRRYINAFRVIMCDALGYPRALVQYLIKAPRRGAGRHFMQGRGFVRHWHWRDRWPGMSAKLFPLAVAVASKAGEGDLSPTVVRDRYRALGLSRNGWAHLMRLPSSVLLELATMMDGIETDGSRRIFLEELSFWFSRLGREYRYYGISRRKLDMALLGAPFLCALFRIGHRVGDFPFFMISILQTLFTDLPHLNDEADQLQRVRWILLGFSRELLATDRDLDLALDDLIVIRDWFVGEGHAFPVNDFRLPFSRLAMRSERWHEEDDFDVYDDDDDGEDWLAPVSEFASDEVVFRALLSDAALREEGSLMKHCVGSYGNRCRSGNMLIYAVDKADVRIGTLAVFFDREQQSSGKKVVPERSWQAHEFKGFRNLDLMPHTRPGQPLQVAVDALLSALNAAANQDWDNQG